MKKNKLIFLFGCFALTLTNCDSTPSSSSNESVSNSQGSSSNDETFNLLGEDYDKCVEINTKQSEILNWNDAYADKGYFQNQNSVVYEEAYVNNVYQTGKLNIKEDDDAKILFYSNNNYAKFVSKSDGYAFTIPTTTILNTDFSIGAYRSKIYNENFTLTISSEHSNPYNKWETYREEWLFRYLDNPNYYSLNNLVQTASPKINYKNSIKGYIVDEYDLYINNPLQIKKNFYNIAIIRKENDIKNFILLVLKSTTNMYNDFQDILLSYTKLTKEGKPSNSFINNLPVKYNENWNEETRNYYKHLCEDNRTGWGAFTATLPDGKIVESQLISSNAYKKFNELSEALDYPFDILPTYQHIAWNRKTSSSWPVTAANNMAGGNGFNRKPVLQMSYQFTDNNNNVGVGNKTDVYTPMFDIYRGMGDDDFMSNRNNPENRYALKMHSIAKEIKEYGHPVLFRLNNEMNTDWTSYCGMMTLLDPDIFQATWRIIYNIFEEEGVDNCIWIFNPMAKSCPFSSWGEDMCYYPGIDYVQALGLTYYEENNVIPVNYYTFRKDYTELYEKNNPVWKNYPWIISEFGCGAGGTTTGEQFRNQETQTQYIQGMFADFNDRENHPYLQNIKGAVWFSVNDYGANDSVVNQYELVIDKLPNSIKALKEGLAPNKY